MKRKFFLSLLTLIGIGAGSLALNNVPASAMKKVDGLTYWSIPEMIGIKAEIAATLQSRCGADDFECRQDYFFGNMDSDTRFFALEGFMSIPFTMTSINLSSGEIRGYFQSQDRMSTIYDPHREKDYLTELYFGWAEPDAPSGVAWSSNLPIDMSGNVFPGYYILYLANEWTDGRGFLPSDEEFRIFIDPEVFDLERVTDGILRYSFNARFSNAVGSIIFSECLNSPYYEPGATCELYAGENSNLIYLPSTYIEPEEEVVTPTTVALVPEPEIEPELPSSVETPAVALGAPESTVESLESEDTTDLVGYGATDMGPEVLVSDVSTISAPETGELTIKREKVSEFPWWVVTVLISADILVMFFLWPDRRN